MITVSIFTVKLKTKRISSCLCFRAGCTSMVKSNSLHIIIIKFMTLKKVLWKDYNSVLDTFSLCNHPHSIQNDLYKKICKKRITKKQSELRLLTYNVTLFCNVIVCFRLYQCVRFRVWMKPLPHTLTSSHILSINIVIVSLLLYFVHKGRQFTNTKLYLYIQCYMNIYFQIKLSMSTLSVIIVFFYISRGDNLT